MEVHSACKDIGARQSLERQLRAVRAAAYGLYLWSHAAHLHGMEHHVDDVHLRVNLLLHVVVLVLYLCHHGALAVLLTHPGSTLLHEVLAVLKLVAVVVADDIAESGVLGVCLDACEMIESLIALSGLRTLVGRQHGGKLRCQHTGINHLALGISGMHAHALDSDFRPGGIEVLKFQLAHVAAVHGVSPLAAKLLNVEVMCAHANLLVRIEGYAYVTVLHLLMVAQPAHRLYYLGNASLVVGTEKCLSVGHYQVLAHMVKQFGKFLRTRHNALAQLNVAAVVVAHYPCLNVGAAAVGTGVIMADETYCGHFLTGVRLQGGVDISHLVHLHVAQPFLFKFFL